MSTVRESGVGDEDAPVEVILSTRPFCFLCDSAYEPEDMGEEEDAWQDLRPLYRSVAVCESLLFLGAMDTPPRNRRMEATLKEKGVKFWTFQCAACQRKVESLQKALDSLEEFQGILELLKVEREEEEGKSVWTPLQRKLVTALREELTRKIEMKMKHLQALPLDSEPVLVDSEKVAARTSASSDSSLVRKSPKKRKIPRRNLKPQIVISSGQEKCFLCGASCAERRCPVNLRAVCRYLNVEASDVLKNKESCEGGEGQPPPDFQVDVCVKCERETRQWMRWIQEEELIKMRVEEGLTMFRRRLTEYQGVADGGEEGQKLWNVLEEQCQSKMESLGSSCNPKVVVKVAPTLPEDVKSPPKKKRKCQHPPKWSPRNPLKPWKCPHFECGATFPSRSDLLQHYRSPHPELSAQCAFCPETFNRRRCLDFHTVRRHLLQVFLECKSDSQNLEQFRVTLFSVLREQLKGAFQRSRKGVTTRHKCAHCPVDFVGAKKIHLMVHLVYQHRQLLIENLNGMKNEEGEVEEEMDVEGLATFQAEMEEMETDDWVETYYDEIFSDMVSHEEYWRQQQPQQQGT